MQEGFQNRFYIANILAERMKLEDIEAKNANETAYDISVKFDAYYHECERRMKDGLNPDNNKPEGEPYPADISVLSTLCWEGYVRCHQFHDIQAYFEMCLRIVKLDITQDALDKLHDMASKKYGITHWFDKRPGISGS